MILVLNLEMAFINFKELSIEEYIVNMPEIQDLILDDYKNVLRGTYNNKGSIPTSAIQNDLVYLVDSTFPGFYYIIINHNDYSNFIIWAHSTHNISYIKQLQARLYDYFAFKVRGDCSLNVYPNFNFKVNLCNFKLKNVNRVNPNIILEFISRNKTINNSIYSNNHIAKDVFNKINIHE